jgi:hypothetical protein
MRRERTRHDPHRSRPCNLAPPPPFESHRRSLCPLNPHSQATQNTTHAARHFSHTGRNSGQTQLRPGGTTTPSPLPALNEHGMNASASLPPSLCRGQRPSASLPALNEHGMNASASLPPSLCRAQRPSASLLALNAHDTSACASLAMPISRSTSASTALRASFCRAQRARPASRAVSSSRPALQVYTHFTIYIGPDRTMYPRLRSACLAQATLPRSLHIFDVIRPQIQPLRARHFLPLPRPSWSFRFDHFTAQIHERAICISCRGVCP